MGDIAISCTPMIKTWQFYPYSSVVEFEIFKHELNRFIKLLIQIPDFYETEMLLKRKM